jgi:hypothetical protein
MFTLGSAKDKKKEIRSQFFPVFDENNSLLPFTLPLLPFPQCRLYPDFCELTFIRERHTR